jgi:hypothetical protein
LTPMPTSQTHDRYVARVFVDQRGARLEKLPISSIEGQPGPADATRH